MSKVSPSGSGQALVEYVLVLGCLSLTAALVAPVVRNALVAVQVRWMAGLTALE